MVALCLAKFKPTTSMDFCPILFPYNHYPWTIGALKHSHCGPFSLFKTVRFMVIACMDYPFSFQLCIFIPLHFLSPDGVQTVFLPMANSSVRKKKLMDSLIAHWLLKPPNHNSNNKRLIDVYLNTQTCKFASSLNCHMGIHSQIITNGLTYLLQGFSIIVFNGKLVKFDPDCY